MDDKKIILILISALQAAIRWGEFSGHLSEGVPADGGWDPSYRNDVNSIRVGLDVAAKFEKDPDQ